MFGFLKNGKARRPFVSAIIAAGGSSARMGGENKLLCHIAGRPVLEHTLRAFEQCDAIDEIIIVARQDMVVEYSNLGAAGGISKLAHVVCGGGTRLESVYKGMAHVSQQAMLVAVHDGARPCVTGEEIARVCRAAEEHTCAVAVTPLSDTIKRVKAGAVTGTEDRAQLFAALTPQAADKALLYAALKRAMEVVPAVTDESMALEQLGARPAAVVCKKENLKVTTPEDLLLAEIILDRRG